MKKKLAAAVAKRPACASGSAEGVATKPEHAVKRIKTTKTKTEIEEVTPKKIRSSMPHVTPEEPQGIQSTIHVV